MGWQREDLLASRFCCGIFAPVVVHDVHVHGLRAHDTARPPVIEMDVFLPEDCTLPLCILYKEWEFLERRSRCYSLQHRPTMLFPVPQKEVCDCTAVVVDRLQPLQFTEGESRTGIGQLIEQRSE